MPDGAASAAWWRLLGAAALGLLVAFVYRDVGAFGFVDYDDGLYVTANALVQRGLTREGVRWAFTTLSAANWHPLTWLSLMADVSLCGVDPGWLHRANALWHAANTLLLWLVLDRLTGARWRSWVVAALFAAHPLHVESVAWISERKDLLSTFFWLLAMGAWGAYSRRPSPFRYVAVAVPFTLGLLSKPMVVTLPIVLLLLDFWPLGRTGRGPGSSTRLRKLALEKVPLLALSAASSAITILAQDRGGATATEEALPFASRLGNAVLAAASYLYKMVWPQDLAAFYPNPASSRAGLPAGRVVIAALLIAALTAAAVRYRERRPYLLFGWLWYAVTLLPVIGILQVGRQGMADRYTYVPLIGIFVSLVWLVPATWTRTMARRIVTASGAAALVLALAITAQAQASHWRDTFSLFHHAAQVTEDNWLAWKNLGVLHYHRGEPQLAVDAFQRSVRARPDEPDAWFNLGAAFADLDRHAEAAECFRRAAMLGPDDPQTWFSLGVSLALLRDSRAAAEAVERVGRLDPTKADELRAIVDRIDREYSAR